MINRQAARASLSGLFVGDALSMPVHWYYNPGDIVRQFGTCGIQKMHAAPSRHPSSIMSLHSTKTGGRRLVEGEVHTVEVVGDVILKGKRELWGTSGTHYHHGLPAGENTLNAWWARELMQYLIDERAYSSSTWIHHYIDFMTAEPARHPDTYAESCHRGFFANWISGKDPLQCGAVTHDTPSMGALVILAPLVIAMSRDHPVDEIKLISRQHIWLTHPDEFLMQVVDAYVELLHRLLTQSERFDEANLPVSEHLVMDYLQQAVNVTGNVLLDTLVTQKRGDAAVVGGKYSLACYITDSWPSVCYLAAKYYKSPDKALVINTNLGGENAHRGAVLGTLVGAASAQKIQLHQQLAQREAVDLIIEKFLDQFVD